jgi:hypothetical protein
MNENQSNLLGYKSWDYLDIKDHMPFITESQIEVIYTTNDFS